MAKSKEADLALAFQALVGHQVEYEASQRTLDRSSSKTKADMIRKQLTPVQRALYEDKSRHMSIMAPRRSGKSYGILCCKVADCVENKKWRVAIICLTKPHAEEIYWSDLLNLNDKYDLKMTFNNTKLIARFPNGSRLVFAGAESKQEISKVRGRKFDAVVIDESAEYDNKLFQTLVHKAVTPALMDSKGSLWLAGTPNGPLVGEFYEATAKPAVKIVSETGETRLSNRIWGEEDPVEPYKWSFHTWTSKDNTALPHLWEEALGIKKWNGWKDDNPTWRMEYLAEWVTMDSAAVFNVRRHQHTYYGPWPWEDERKNRCRFVVGGDFGYHDGTAIVIWCYLDDEPYLYEFLSVKRRQLVQAQIADLYRECEKLLPSQPLVRVGDPGGGGVTLMEGLRVEHGIAFETADKNYKVDNINYLNSALDSNLVRFRPNSDLMDEMEQVLWEDRTYGTSRQREDPRFPNDLCDAALYAFKVAKMRLVAAPELPPPELGEEDRIKAEYVANRDRAQRPWWYRRE